MHTVSLFSPLIAISLQREDYRPVSIYFVVPVQYWNEKHGVQMRIKPNVWKAMSNWRNSFEGESLLLPFRTQSLKVLGSLGSHQLQREFSVQYFLAELGVQKGEPDDNELIGWHMLTKRMVYGRKHFFNNF